MALKTVLYQTVFAVPLKPTTAVAVTVALFTPFDTPQGLKFSAAEQQFSAWHSPFPPQGAAKITNFAAGFVPFDTPRAPQYAAAEQQFSAYIGFTPPAGSYTSSPAFDAPQAPKYSATEQQFSAWHSPFFGTKTPSFFTETPYDAPQAPKYPAAEQQFSAYGAVNFAFGTATPTALATFVPFDAPQGLKYGAAEQQFTAWHSPFVVPPVVTLIAALTSTPFDAPQTPKYNAAEVQFTAFSGMVFSPPVEMGTDFDVPVQEPVPANIHQFIANTEGAVAAPPVTLIAAFTSTPFDAPKAPLYSASLQQFSAILDFLPPVPAPVTSVFTPFDEPKGLTTGAAHQQFGTWHSPFFGTQTPAYASGFVPFDTPQAPKYGAGEQQFSVYNGSIVQFTQTPNYLAQFYVDTAIPERPVAAALLQFQDLFLGYEQTTAAPATIGRWGPDETAEERRRRHKAGIFLQWEEMPSRSEFAPDPVEHPAHEPQKWADEPAAVRTGAKADPVSGVEFAAVLNEQIDAEFWDDPEVLDLIEKFLENGWRR